MSRTPVNDVPRLGPSSSVRSRLRGAARAVAREVRNYPATAAFSAAWIAVFVAMVWIHWWSFPRPTWWRLLVLGIGDGHRFGDLTLRELGQGQVWRLITCTFVHYSVVHITLNLLAFYLLGTLLESWYGSPQLVLIYAITGGGGNLVSALIRVALGSDPSHHAGGGSVVVMGLIGLCAMVGWRSRTKRGSDLGWQMSKALGMTGILGLAFPRYIDNWGHAGGALVGFVLGFFHNGFLARYASPKAWGAGMISALVIVGCLLAQYRADLAERPQRDDQARRLELEIDELAYRSLREAIFLVDRRADPRLIASALDRASYRLDRKETRDELRRIRELAGLTATRQLSEPEKQEFKERAGALVERLRKELEIRFREYRRERVRPAAQPAQRGRSTGPLVKRAPSR